MPKSSFQVSPKVMLWVLSFTFLLMFSQVSYANNQDVNTLPVTVSIYSEKETMQPGKPFWVSLHIQIEKGWHAYWKNPGNTGFPLTVDWILPTGFKASDIHWQVPERLHSNDVVAFGYEDEIYLLAEITPPETLSSSPPIEIQAQVRWLVCSQNMCLPGNALVNLPLPTSLNEPNIDNRWTAHFSKARELQPKKTWSFHAEQKDNDLNLNIVSPYQEDFEIAKATFFPEHRQLIDCAVDPELSNAEFGKCDLQFKLHPALSSENVPSSLKGILVVEGTYKGKPLKEALEIDAPLNLNGIKGLDSDSIIQASLPPNQKEVAFTSNLALSDNHNINEQTIQETSEEVTLQTIATTLLFAFLGGVILNLMPCVLPVLSIKVLSFINMAGQKRSLTLKHGCYFSLGVLVSFWVLAAALMALQAYGKSVGWGFQLQQPIFVALLAAVFVIFGLGLFGLFEMGMGVATWAGGMQSRPKEKLSSSFFSGVLATAVATPCTGPFLGAAVGMAFTLPPSLAMLIFTFLALGMASPYLILSAFPSLLRFLPKPGTWMERFKELMGFFMLMTTLWLIWVFGAQTNNSAVFMLLSGLLCLSFAVWIWGRWGTPIQKVTTRSIGRSLALAAFLVGGYVIAMSPSVQENGSFATTSNTQASVDSSGERWEPFSKERIAQLQSQGIPVLVDFTAKWCLVCQTNHVVFSQEDVNNKLNSKGVVRMLADWTTGDERITAELQKFKRNSVPLYLLYDADPSAPPQVLPQVLTPQIVLEHLDKISDNGTLQ